MEERDKKTELLVGLFLFIGLLLLGGLILQFGSVRELLKTTYEITVPFPDATGVKEATPVMLGGSRIGKVPRLPKLNDQFNGVIIPLEIYHDKKIPIDAKFSIGTAGLLGDSFIEIRTSGKNTEKYIEPGAVLTRESVSTSGGLGALSDTAAQVGQKADKVMDDMRSVLADVRVTMGKVNTDALSEDTLKHFRASFEHLNTMMTRLDTQVLSDENTKELKATIAELHEAATGFKNTAKAMEEQANRLGPMFDKLDPAIAKADKVMASAEAALKSFKQVGDNLTSATRGLKGGDGLLKALLEDQEMKDNFKDLFSNLKRNGVLFYKDTAGKSAEEERKDRASVPRSPLSRPGR